MSHPLTYVGTARKGVIDYELPAKVRSAQVAKAFPDMVVEVEIREFHQQRSHRQNRGFHAMVTPWAKERGWRVEALKQFLLKQVFGVLEFVHPQTGEVHEVLAQPHTSTLTVPQFSELIEATLELAAEDGVFLTAPDEYRRQQEARQQAPPPQGRERSRHAMSDDILDDQAEPTRISRPRGVCGKVRYDSEAAAKRSIRGQDTKGRAQRWKGRLGTYFCKPCRSWHVGHTDG